MKEYRGFKYKVISGTQWVLRFPSGFKTFVIRNGEQEVKDLVDELKLQFED